MRSYNREWIAETHQLISRLNRVIIINTLLNWPVRSKNRVFTRSGHIVQNHTRWEASCTVGLPKQRQFKVDWYELFCFGSPTVKLASQRVRFCSM